MRASFHSRSTWQTRLVLLIGALTGQLLDSPVTRAEPAAPNFLRDVRPILASTCFKCHGPDDKSRQGGLRLDLRDAATAAADSGATAIVPGDPEASELIVRILSTDEETRMPPASTKKELSEAQKETLRRWVLSGANYQPHWAFERPRRPPVPEVPGAAGPVPNPIDAFVRSRLAKEGFPPSLAADKFSLVRRLYLDLIGLPPTIEEADAFVQDRSADAYVKLVIKLLESPHYGERWARKWLDLARYADTNGYEKDRPRNVWPYRDWVIRALNADMPFDQFTVEQLAGDLLPSPSQDQLVATGFHRNTMLNEEGGIDPLEFRFLAMTDRVATTGTTWLGLTLGCAQCHTHKYDPVTQREYYQLMAFLNNADEPELDLASPDLEARYQQNLAEADRLLAKLPDQWPKSDQQPKTLDQAFAEWLQKERERTVTWRTLRPAAVSSNLPVLTVETDGSVFVAGDITKDDRYQLTFHGVPAGTTAIRLEALADPRLPAHGPGLTYYEGPKGDFFLGEFQLSVGERPIKIGSATESYAKNHFGGTASAQLATDGDPQTGWTCAGRYGETHHAVFDLAEPLAEGGDLSLMMQFGRHFACSLGRFRISATISPGAQARDLPLELETLLRIPDADLSADQRSKLKEQFLLTAPELMAASEKIRELRRPPTAPTSLVMRERPAENPRPTFFHHRGEYLQPKEQVAPGVPSFLPRFPADAAANRLAFARWLVSPAQPLTARVVVNRQWAAFFGQGLVRTAGDFGFQGELPSHPELLDWLAVEFMEQGWSLKKLHRLIVLSETYRQSSQATPEQIARDPQNILLSRGPRVRVDAELVRDVALQASGLLSLKMFGPPVYPPQPASVTEAAYGGGKWQASDGEDRYRRAIYTFTKRTAPYAMFNTFDAPSGEICVARREVSNTPLQSLTLLNDEVLVESSQALGRLVADRPGDDADKITWAFRRCVTRPPTSAELSRIVEFLGVQRSRLEKKELDANQLAGKGPSDHVAERAAWTLVARVLLNLDETITKN